jgi:hypothetical protein
VRTIHPERFLVIGQHTQKTRQGPRSSNSYEAPVRISSGGPQPSHSLSRFTGIAVRWRDVQRPRRRRYLSSARMSREVDHGIPERDSRARRGHDARHARDSGEGGSDTQTPRVIGECGEDVGDLLEGD